MVNATAHLDAATTAAGEQQTIANQFQHKPLKRVPARVEAVLDQFCAVYGVGRHHTDLQLLAVWVNNWSHDEATLAEGLERMRRVIG